jgi:TPR repeat protein
VAPKDWKEAVNRLLKEAQSMGVAAQYQLGECYLYALGVTQDLEKSAKWIRSAAISGHTEASYQLGLFYELGTGIAQNRAEAERWFRRAAKQGHQEAAKRLKVLLAKHSEQP